MISTIGPHVASWARPRLDLGGCVLYVPLWHPTLAGSSFQSKDSVSHTCTVEGPTWGVRGRTFDGTNDYISIPDAATLDITGALTIEAWINVAGLGGANGGGILAKSPFTTAHGTYQIFITGTSNKFGVDLNAGAIDVATNTTPTLNVWYHAVATYDLQNIRLYLNAVQDGTAAYTAAITADNNVIHIGHYYSTIASGTHFFNGVIGEVRVYNRALSVAEILHNYQSTKWRYQ